MFEKRKIKQLLLEIEMYKKNFESMGLFSLLHTKYMEDYIDKSLNNSKKELKTTQLLKFCLDTAKSNDSVTQVDLEVGKRIEELINDENNMMFIHRSKLSLDENNTSKDLESIMRDGLINYGHINAKGGVAYSLDAPGIGTTLTPMIGLSGYINLLSNWHNYDSVIVFSIPRELLDKDNDFIDNNLAYNNVDGKYYIKPEYIVGNIVKKDSKLISFDLREDILNKNDINYIR